MAMVAYVGRTTQFAKSTTRSWLPVTSEPSGCTIPRMEHVHRLDSATWYGPCRWHASKRRSPHRDSSASTCITPWATRFRFPLAPSSAASADSRRHKKPLAAVCPVALGRQELGVGTQTGMCRVPGPETPAYARCSTRRRFSATLVGDGPSGRESLDARIRIIPTTKRGT